MVYFTHFHYSSLHFICIWSFRLALFLITPSRDLLQCIVINLAINLPYMFIIFTHLAKNTFLSCSHHLDFYNILYYLSIVVCVGWGKQNVETLKNVIVLLSFPTTFKSHSCLQDTHLHCSGFSCIHSQYLIFDNFILINHSALYEHIHVVYQLIYISNAYSSSGDFSHVIGHGRKSFPYSDIPCLSTLVVAFSHIFPFNFNYVHS